MGKGRGGFRFQNQSFALDGWPSKDFPTLNVYGKCFVSIIR